MNRLSLEHRIPPPIVMLTLAGLAYLVHAHGPQIEQPLARLGQLLSWPLILIGISLDLIGFFSFVRARTTVNPLAPERSQTLVVQGLYRYSRNPMYLGMALSLAGWALWLGDLLALAVVPIFIAYIQRFQIAPEERALLARFGDDYRQYCAQVRRWL